MSLMIRDPWQLLDQWRREMDQLYTPTRDDETRVVGSSWAPAVDIKEEPDCYVLHADIPGVRPEDIDISMDKGVLTIRGERRHAAEESKEGYHRRERQHGVFMRRFSLPETVDAEAISAASKDGVLELVLPKTAEPQPRKIEVKS
jgi:HSP20 family protein